VRLNQRWRQLPSGKSGPRNWNWKVEVKEEKTGRVTKILYRSIIRYERQVEVKIMLTKYRGLKILEGRLYQGNMGPFYYTNDLPQWLYAEFNGGLEHRAETGEEYFPEPPPVPPVKVTTPDNSRYAGVYIRGLDEPWTLREGYLVSVVESRSEGCVVQTKVIIEMQTRFKIELVLNRFKDGRLISGREYLGPVGG
jgi:hypothetical protein